MSRGDSAATAGGNDAGSDEARRLHNWVRAGRHFSAFERHCFYQNRADGTFRDLSAVSGLDFDDDGRGLAFTDWDGDGDLDVWIANRSAPQLRFLQNRKPEPASAVTLRLVGTMGNRDAIGARVVLQVEGQKPQTRTVTAGSGFLSQSTKTLHFGLGGSRQAEVTVHWPGGGAEVHAGVTPGHYSLVQGGQPKPPAGTGHPELSAQKSAFSLEPTEAMRLFSATRVTLPRLAYADLDGRTQLVPARPPRPLLIKLWASWCVPCAPELAAFADAKDSLASAGIDVLALTVESEDELAATREFLAKNPFPHPVGRVPERTGQLLQIVNNRLFDRHRPLPVPTSLLVSPEGYLAALYKGGVHPETVIADAAKLGLEQDGLRVASLPFPGRWVSKGLAQFRPFALASELVEEGFFDEAVDYMERTRETIEGDGEFAVLLARFGNESFRLAQGDAAIAWYRLAIEQDPELAVAHQNLGITLNRKGDGEAAEAALRRAIELDPDAALAHRELGMNLTNRGRSEEAVPLFRKAIEIAPDDMTTVIHLARALVSSSPSEALALAQRADAATRHAHPNVLAVLADAQQASGDVDAASATANRALEIARQRGNEALAAELEAKIATWR